jgi:5-methylthioadenosine/S-adenosylhomocysteine deaminase
MPCMNTLIRNAMVIPMTPFQEQPIIGDIGISGTHIAFIGQKPQDFQPDETIDATSMIAMPGLVNAHTHLSMVYFRNYKDSVDNLHDWLAEIWPLEDLLTPQDILPASRLGIAEMISSGITCFADMYLFPEATCEAVLESKIKANIGLTLFGDLAESKRRMHNRLPSVERHALASNGRIHLDAAPHAIYTCTEETLRYAGDFAKERSCRIHTHISETRKEVQDCIAEHHLSPVAYLDNLGILNSHTYLAHCVHPTADDYALLAHSGASVIHNPSSNCKLASGIAPLAQLSQVGINLALGTDGASSNNTLDLFQEIRLGAMLSAVSTGNPIALTPYEILRMATYGGAKALGREQECGTLEPGKDADIILIDTKKNHLSPLNNVFSALVFAAKSTDVDTVFCQGEKLMQGRSLCTVDAHQGAIDTQLHWNSILNRTN